MKRSVVLVILLILSVLGGGVYKYAYPLPDANTLTLYGNVDVRQVEISFRVPGKLAELFFEEGDVVSKGALMAILDKSPYDNQVRQAAASTKSLKASVDHASILLKRRQELIEGGSISLEDLNNAEASFDELFAQLKSSEASLDTAIDNLEYTHVYAPTDGIVLTRIREPGSVVRETDPVYTLSIASPVWIRAFIDESYLGRVDYGMEVEVITDNLYGHSYVGKVGFISPFAEFTPKTVETTKLRTDLVYRLRIYVDKPDAGLRQGMPVTVKLNIKDTKSP